MSLNILIVMQRKEIVGDHQLDKTIDQLANNQKIKSRVTSLAPYIAEIERRKKNRDLARVSKKNINTHSSRQFRIKEKSLTSLHKDTSSKNKEANPQSVITKLLEQRATRDQRTKSLQRHREVCSSKTIEHRGREGSTVNTNSFFNDLYVRVKNKVQKEKEKPRKRQYQTLQAQRSRSSQSGTMNFAKFAHNITVDTKMVISQAKKQQPKRTNFRRNKFEACSSAQLEASQKQCKKQQLMSDSKLQLDKKQSNVSINKQMDKLALNQMLQYQQIRNKQFHRSVDKSNEKYFSFESYRPAKSKNDIQVILSTAKNPSLHKVSHSTTDKQPLANHSLDGHVYDFSFTHQQDQFEDINEIQCPSEQQSRKPFGGHTVFIGEEMADERLDQ